MSIKIGLNRLFKEKTDNTLVQLFRYTFVGGIAFLVDFGSLYFLTEFAGLHYLLSAIVAFLLGLATNYILSILWVFSKRKVRSVTIEFSIFAFIGVIGLGLNEFFMWFFTEQVGTYYLISKILSAILVYLWNFGARKRILFT